MFGQKAETSLSEAQLLEKKAALVAEITHLGEKVSEANAILDEKEALATGVEALKAEHAEAIDALGEIKYQQEVELAVIEKIAAEIKVQELRKADLIKEGEAITHDNASRFSEGQEQAKNATLMLADLTDKCGTVKSEISFLKNEAAKGSSELSKLDSDLIAVCSEISAANKELEGLNAKKKEAEESLQDEADRFLALSGEIGKAKAALVSVNGEIEAAKANLASIEELGKIEEAIITDAKASLAEEKAALTVREGEASRREEWNAKDRKQLKDIKTELEAVHKKEIPISI